MSATAVLVLAATFLLGCMLTAGARWSARRIGLVDRPDGGRKRHAQPVPLMGGAAICASFFIAALLLKTAVPELPEVRRADSPGLLPLLASAGLFCLLGLYDDRYGLRPRYKLLWQIAACLPFVLWGDAVMKLGLLGGVWPLGGWSLPFTVFWLVACSNVINLMDGMDGLAGTISCIALLTLAAMSMLIGRAETAFVALAAAASVAGFLVHNWPPAKIFMGDSGSLMLGFLIGALAIRAALKQAAGFTLVVPLVLISVPIFDTAMAILRRKLSGRGIGDADRRHIHHYLQDQGLSRMQALLLIAGLCAAMAGFGMLSFWVNSEVLALLLCGSLLVAMVIARIFGHYEAGLALQHLRAIGGLLLDTSRVLPSRLLTIRLTHMEPQRRDDYWRLVCGRLAECGTRHLEVRFTDAGRNVVDRLCWTADTPAAPGADTWEVKHSVLRDHGVRATLTAGGTADGLQWAAQMNEASQLIHALCRAWPVGDAQRDSAEAGLHVIPFDDSIAGERPAGVASSEEVGRIEVREPRAA